ncbi:transposable element Tcb1 transposase [Trichonephila clavipes]|nr:transposable element Tcb1 transposase [Trichonephila clavipes]
MQEGTTDRRCRSPPPQSTTSRENRKVVRMTLTDHLVTLRTVAQHIESITHHSMSARTTRRRLQQNGLSARRPLLGLPVKQNHRRLRGQWCDERRMWVAEWNEVVFTDESRICLQHHDGRIRVWRHRRERMLNSCVMHSHTGSAPDQQKKDINSAPFISLCLDESTDISKSARLAVSARYWVGNVIKEELIAITSLLTTTKGTDICTAVRNSLAEKDIDLKRIVSATTDGASNMDQLLHERCNSTFHFISVADWRSVNNSFHISPQEVQRNYVKGSRCHGIGPPLLIHPPGELFI